MISTTHVYSSPAELEAARAKCETFPWARAALGELFSPYAPPKAHGLPSAASWRWALAGTVAGREDVQRRAAEAICSIGDIVTACGGNALVIARAINPIMGAFELIRHLLSPSQEERILAMLREGVTAIWERNRQDANCQTMYNCAMTGYGLLVGDAAWVERAIEDEERGLLRHLRRGFRPDGLWWEGSLSYHLEVIQAVQMQAELLRRAGRDLYREPEIAAILKAMYDAPLCALSPALDAFNKNDGNVTESLPAWAALYEIPYARFRDPLYGLILARGNRASPEALLYGEAEVTATPPTAASAVLPHTGWAVLRAPRDASYWQGDGMCALLDFGPHGGWHGHPDALSLDYHALGVPLLSDQGSSPIGYGGREHWEWYRQTLAHNTVTVDGVPQGFVYGDDDALTDARAGGRLTLAALDAEIQVVEARHDAAYAGAVYRRAVATIGDEYLVDFFQVALPGAHVFDYALHGPGWLTLDQPTVPAADTFRPTAQRGLPREPDALPWASALLREGEWRSPDQDPHAAYNYAQDVYACDADGLPRATFHGGRWGDGHFWPGGESLAVHLLPDAPCRVFACRTPRRQPPSYGPTLVVRHAGDAAHFTAVLAPYRAAADERRWGVFTGSAVSRPEARPPAVKQARLCAVEPETRGVIIDTADGMDVVLHTFRERATIAIAEPAIRFEGKFCCLRFDAQRRVRAFRVIDGVHLEAAGRTLFHAEDGRPACCDRQED